LTPRRRPASLCIRRLLGNLDMRLLIRIEENGYWKEIGSRPKRLVYYAFPGLVFG